MRSWMMVGVAMIWSLSARTVLAASIGLFSTADCTSCNLTVPEGGSSTLYIRFTGLSGLPWVNGLLGAEFKVTGLPDGWIAVSTRSAASYTAFGDPFGPTGASLGFPTPQTGDCINLYTVTLTSTSAAADIVLRVTKRTPPTNPDFPCPRATVECGPCFPLICVGGGGLLINSETECTVAVEGSTWSRIKLLYEK
ncbi:MAG: hypothetical protein ACE5G2_04290 [Candidatus Krumholzibacteriia bacterium]